MSLFLALLGYCISKSLEPELVRFVFHFNSSWLSVASWLDDQDKAEFQDESGVVRCISPSEITCCL